MGHKKNKQAARRARQSRDLTPPDSMRGQSGQYHCLLLDKK